MKFVGLESIDFSKQDTYKMYKNATQQAIFEIKKDGPFGCCSDDNWWWINRPSPKYGYKKYIKDIVETDEYIFENCLCIGYQVMKYKNNYPYIVKVRVVFTDMKNK